MNAFVSVGIPVHYLDRAITFYSAVIMTGVGNRVALHAQGL